MDLSNWAAVAAACITGLLGLFGGLFLRRTPSIDADSDRLEQIKTEIMAEYKSERDELRGKVAALEETVSALEIDHVRIARHDVALRMVTIELMRIEPDNVTLRHVQALLGDEFDQVTGSPANMVALLRKIDRSAARHRKAKGTGNAD